MAAYEKIKLEVADGVATITLDDPETRNALSDQLLTELLDALRAVKDDDDARVVVLASSHEKVFSAGGNLGGFAADAPTAHKYFGTGSSPRSSSSSASWASRRSSPRPGTSWPARSASPSPAT